MLWLEIWLAVVVVLLAILSLAAFAILAIWLRRIEEALDETCLLIMALDHVRFPQPNGTKRPDPGSVVRLDDYRKDV